MLTAKLLNFSPFISLTFFSLIILLLISFKRKHKVTFLLTLTSLIITLVTSIFIIFSNSNYEACSLFEPSKTAFIFNTIIIISTINVCFFSYFWLRNVKFQKEEYYFLLLLTTLGCTALSLTNNMISLFLVLEFTSMSFLGLISFNKTSRKLIESTWKYMVISAFSSIFLLLGIMCIYSIVGAFSFIKIKTKTLLLWKTSKMPLIMGFTLILLCFLLKISIFPFHFLTPDLYESLSVPTTMYYSTVFKISFIFLLLKVFLLIPVQEHSFILSLTTIFAFLSIITGNLLAIFQKNIKRFLGYLSITHFGFLLIPFALFDKNSFCLFFKYILLYIVSYSISNLITLGSIFILEQKKSENYSSSFSDYRGIFSKNPIVTLSFIISLISFIGIPSTIGFVSKTAMLFLTENYKNWILTSSVVLSSALGIYCYFKLITNLICKTEPDVPNCFITKNKKNFSNSLTLIVFFFSILIVVFGLFPQILVNFITHF